MKKCPACGEPMLSIPQQGYWCKKCKTWRFKPHSRRPDWKREMVIDEEAPREEE